MWINKRNVLLSPILVPLPLKAAIFSAKLSEKWMKPLPHISIGVQYSNLKEEMLYKIIAF